MSKLLTELKKDPKVFDFINQLSVNYFDKNYDKNIEILREYLNELKGNTNPFIWYLLFDLYQIKVDRQSFDKLADMFVRKFLSSPPSWESRKINDIYSSGRNVLILDGALDNQILEKSKDFIRYSRDVGSCKIECGKLEIWSSTKEGLFILLNTMQKLRKNKIKTLILGDAGVTGDLMDFIKLNKQVDQIYWLLLLELLQWDGKEEEFNSYAFEYASLFDVSPPGYEIREQYTIKEEDILPQTPSTIEDIEDFNIWFTKLKFYVKQKKPNLVEINLEHTEFINKEALDLFVSSLNNISGYNISLKEPNAWILFYLLKSSLFNDIKIISKKML